MFNITGVPSQRAFLTSPSNTHFYNKNSFGSVSFPTINNIQEGKTFTNPNFVNKQNPNIHNYTNYCDNIKNKSNTLTSDSDKSSALMNNSSIHTESYKKTNSSPNIIDKVKHFEVVQDPNIQKEVPKTESNMCHTRRSNKRGHTNKRGNKPPGKNSKQHKNFNLINDMMDVDMEYEISVCSSENNSPKQNCITFSDFLMNIPTTQPQPTACIEFEMVINDDKMEPESVSSMSISISPINSCASVAGAFRKQRQLSTTSEDSFIVFSSETEDECDFSEDESDCSDSESDDDDDSSTSVIPVKRVRFRCDSELQEVHPMIQWSYAYQAARKGPWEQYARDRDRFKQRISNVESNLAPVFDVQHRERIYNERFINNTDE